MIIGFLILMLGVYVIAFQQVRQDSMALNLKLRQLEEERRIPTSWENLINQRRGGTQTVASTPQEQEQEQEVKAPEQDEGTQQPFEQMERMSTADLAYALDQTMENIQAKDIRTISRAIDAADELIAREPLSYAAYKAKLILLLTLEGKFDVAVDETEVNFLLNEMATFDVENNESLMVSQALKDSKTRAELDQIESEMDNVQTELNLVAMRLESRAQTLGQEQELVERERQLVNQLQELEESAQAAQAPDIIEIPFQRQLANGDYDFVIEDATTLLQEFPSSVVGHYYLIRALEMDNRHQDALNVLQNLQLPPQKIRELQARLKQAEDPDNYWRNLDF